MAEARARAAGQHSVVEPHTCMSSARNICMMSCAPSGALYSSISSPWAFRRTCAGVSLQLRNCRRCIPSHGQITGGGGPGTSTHTARCELKKNETCLVYAQLPNNVCRKVPRNICRVQAHDCARAAVTKQSAPALPRHALITQNLRVRSGRSASSVVQAITCVKYTA